MTTGMQGFSGIMVQIVIEPCVPSWKEGFT